MDSESPSLAGWGYFKRVAKTAASDAWEYLRHRVLWAAGLLAIGAVVGVKVNPLSFVALVLLAALFFGVFLGRAPASLAREERERADQRLAAVNDELRATHDRLAALESKPVSDDHRKELQVVARTLLEGVSGKTRAHYLPRGDGREYLAWSFREHFEELAKDLDGWNAAVDKLDEAQKAHESEIRALIEAKGLTGWTGMLASSLAEDSWTDEPPRGVEDVRGCLMYGMHIRLAELVASGDQEDARPIVEDLCQEARGGGTKYSRVRYAQAMLRGEERSLVDTLRRISVTHRIVGKCELC